MKAAKTRALHKRATHGSKRSTSTHAAAKAHKRAPKVKKTPVRRTAVQVKAAHARAFSPGGAACCSAEALAASLRLAGWPVADVDVLALHKLTASSPDAAAPLWRTLEAALAYGLAGVRPVSFEPVSLDDPAAVILGLDLPEAPHAVTLDPSGGVWSWGGLYDLGGEAVVEEAWTVTWPRASA